MTTLHAEAVDKRTWPQYLGWGLFLVLLAWAWHWDDRGVLWVAEGFETPAERLESVWLPDYHAVWMTRLT